MIGNMIRSFGDKRTECVFHREPIIKGFSVQVQRAALRKLLILDAATTLNDLRVPSGNRLEKLKGDRAGQYSIRVNSQWRICFRWTAGDTYDVEVVDYH